MKSIFTLSIILLLGAFSATFAQTTYTFNGNGNWSDAKNWADNLKPPTILDSGLQIIITPSGNGQCVLDLVQYIASGASLTVTQGKKFNILGDLKSFTDPSRLMNGKIILPSGSAAIDLGNYKVINRLDVSSIINNSYTIDTTHNNLSAIFLVDPNDQPIMMGYIYPGQPDNNITLQSTALGMFMSLPSIQSLTDSSKLALLPKILRTPEFSDLVNEVSRKLNNGGSFADGADLELNSALVRMFDKSTTIRISELLNEPVSFYSAGNHLSIVNNGTANIYGVGLYKDGQLLGSVRTLGGYDYLPTSLGDIIKHLYAFTTNSVIEEPKTLDYVLASDGQYIMKIRSGGQIGDNTAEATLAIRYDLLKGAMNLIALYVPEISKGECRLAVIGKLLSYISTVYSISQLEASSPTTLAQAMLNIASYLFSTSSDLVVGCASFNGVPYDDRYIKTIGKFFYYVNIVGAVNSAINSSIIGYHLQTAKPIIDTCFKVSNGVITSCIAIPAIVTLAVTSITNSTASSGGDISNEGGAPIIARGICWNTTPSPTITNNKTLDGTGNGSFVSSITGLLGSKTYFVRAYATNSGGTAYGSEITFSTLPTPSLAGSTFSLITWRYGGSIPGLINVAAVNDPPNYTYVGKYIRKFDTDATFSQFVYDSSGNELQHSTGNRYSISSYSSDSLFIPQGGPDNTYGHQYTEGWGFKLPPGYNISLAGYPCRLSLDGNFLYEVGDYVYKKL